MAQARSDEVLIVRVASGRYADDHPGWQHQVDQLRSRLSNLEKPVRGTDAEGVPLFVWTDAAEQEGPTKGALDIAALLFASSQMIRAAAVVIREWQKQDAARTVSVEVKRQSVVARGQGRAGVDAVREALVTALGDQEGDRPDAER